MKKLVNVVVLSLLLSCQKGEMSDAMVVRDCTGTYLQIGGKDWRVCNKEKLSAFDDGDQVKVSFSTLSSCNSNEIVCMMLHPSEGHVKVNSVRRN